MAWYFPHTRLLASACLAASPIGTAIYVERERSKKELKSAIKESQKLVESTMAVQGIPGLSVAVSVNGKMIWKAGFGFSNVETGTKCTGDSVMRIASISKPLTATLAAKLVDDGKLDLDADIRRYFSEFPVKTFSDEVVSITMRQLLSHTSGIRHYANSKKISGALEDPRNNNASTEEFLSNKRYASSVDALNIFKNDDLVGKPGEKFFYTTYGITLAGAVLEAITGKSYENQALELFTELGMKHTQLDRNRKIVKKRVSYYLRNVHHNLENCPEVDCSYKFAGGGILSNVADLIIFANAILYSSQATTKNALIKKDTMEVFLKKHTVVNGNTNAGLGWFLVSGKKVESLENAMYNNDFFYHTGAGVGASSALLIRPVEKCNKKPSGVCVAVLCNLQGVSVLSLASSIADLFVDIVDPIDCL